ncbi:MAG: murein biosynthesis integral membrane protein MurJ [Chloroflexota bacterium]|nr:MAG: murein biosynthesis integral membrane protein MurJ [Chloroflexota bacterium]
MGIGKAAFIIMIGNIVSRLLGLVREQVIAGYFGGGANTDAFTAAGRVPMTIYDLLVGGMISAALIPVFSEYVGEDEEAGWRLFSAILSAMALVLCVVALVLGVLSGHVIAAIAGEYDRSTQGVAAQLLRLMVPALVFMGLSGVMTAFLYARRSFVFPAFATAAYNLGVILGAVLLTHYLGIVSLVVGTLLGALAQALLQLPGLGLRRGRMLPRPRLRHEALPRLMRLYVPVMAGLVVSAVGVMIDTRLASQTGEGNLAAMRFATTLIQFPLGLVAAAVSLAVLPSLSAHASAAVRTGETEVGGGEASQRQREARRLFNLTLSRGIRLVALGIFPAAAGLILLRTDIIALLFQRGAFVREDTLRTSTAFLFYSPGIIAAALDQLFIFAFYARKNTITPVIVGLAGVGVYMVVALSLVDRLGMPALAMANSVQWVAHAVIMFVLLWRSMGRVGDATVVATIVKAGAASLTMVAAIFALLTALGPSWGASGVGLVVRVGGMGAVGLAVYVGVLWLLRTEEVNDLMLQARRRLAALPG